jgi:predicted membrane protein
MKGCWFWSMSFSASIDMIKWFLCLLLLICCITFDDLHVLNHPYVAGMKLIWSWCMIFFICYWFWFAIILLRIFASMFIKEIDL